MILAMSSSQYCVRYYLRCFVQSMVDGQEQCKSRCTVSCEFVLAFTTSRECMHAGKGMACTCGTCNVSVTYDAYNGEPLFLLAWVASALGP